MRFSTFLIASFTLASVHAQVTLDPAFGTDGVVSAALDPGYDGAYAMALQADGKVLITGPSGVNGDLDALVARFNADGSMDTSFGTDGVATFDINGDDYTFAIAVQDDGKILLAGSTKTGSNTDMLVLRVNTEGSLDTDFGVAGTVTLDGGSANDKVNAMVVRPDDHVVIGGTGTTSGFSCFYLAQLNDDGTLDTSFGTDGVVKHLVSADNSQLNALALMNDGRIVAAGNSKEVSTMNDFAVCRYMTDGTFDSTFNGTGKVVIAASTANDNANGVAVQSDGSIVIGGVENSTSSSAAIVTLTRLLEAGTLDSTFGTAGLSHLFVGGAPTRAAQVLIQPNGAIIACGTASPVANERDSYLCRVTAEGMPDATFGVNGEQRYGALDLYRETPCMALQPDGKIIVGGIDAGGGVVNTLLLRYGADGTTAISEQANQAGRIDIRSVRPDGISFVLSDAASEVALIDTDGRMLQRFSGRFSSGDNTVRFAKVMPTGAYLLRATTTNGVVIARFAVVR